MCYSRLLGFCGKKTVVYQNHTNVCKNPNLWLVPELCELANTCGSILQGLSQAWNQPTQVPSPAGEAKPSPPTPPHLPSSTPRSSALLGTCWWECQLVLQKVQMAGGDSQSRLWVWRRKVPNSSVELKQCAGRLRRTADSVFLWHILTLNPMFMLQKES